MKRDYVQIVKRAIGIKKDIRELRVECIDMYEREEALVIINGQLYTGETHAVAMGYEDIYRDEIKIGQRNKVAFLNIFDNFVLVEPYDYWFEENEAIEYKFEELIEILKKEYTGLVLIGHKEDDEMVFAEKVIIF